MSDEKKLEESSKPSENQDPKNTGVKSEQSSQSQPVLTDAGTQTANMEVQKHPHHVTHKKKWQEYLLEFLMLFLAVFLGFLAEYRLEHKIEKDKERQYIESLVEDLSTDTASLSETINNFSNRDKNLDTLLSLFPRLTNGYDHKLHEKLYAITGFADFIKADRTMQQLKNSGGMRLIRNKKAADGITDYDLMSRDLDIDVSSLQDIFNRVMASRFEIIDSEALANDIKINKVEPEAGKKNYLLKSDKPTLGKFNNEIREFKVVCEMVQRSEGKIRKRAVDLIALLKKEYHLE
jgi:hypothetical protein